MYEGKEYSSEVPRNWQSLRKVTVINHYLRTVSFGVLEKHGRLYYHVRYVRDVNMSAGPPAWRPNSWVAQLPINRVTVLEGHQRKQRNRYLKWEHLTREHQQAENGALRDIESQIYSEMANQRATLTEEWRVSNPSPAVPSFFKRAKHS